MSRFPRTPAHRADGTWLFRGRKLTGFTNAEEIGATFAGNAPWLLEDRLRLAGAQFEAAKAARGRAGHRGSDGTTTVN